MSMFTNLAKVLDKFGVELKRATADFYVYDQSVLTMTKIVDKPDDYYVSGQNIKFTITITNTGSKKVNMKFEDVISTQVKSITSTIVSSKIDGADVGTVTVGTYNPATGTSVTIIGNTPPDNLVQLDAGKVWVIEITGTIV